MLNSLAETDEYNALGIPKNIQETKSIIEVWTEASKLPKIKNYTSIIEKKLDIEFIGLFELKLGAKKYNRGEVWYKIHSDFWGNGFATEALQAVIHFGFETIKLHRIEAGCAVNNVASIKVLEKTGMTREGRGRGRQLLPLKSGWSDNY